MLFLPQWMKNSMCWQERKGIRPTSWQSKLIWICNIWRDLEYLTAQHATSSQPRTSIWHSQKGSNKRSSETYTDRSMITSLYNHTPLPQPAFPWTRDRPTSGPRLRKRTRTRSWCRSWSRRARSRLRFVCFWHLWREGRFSITPNVRK